MYKILVISFTFYRKRKMDGLVQQSEYIYKKKMRIINSSDLMNNNKWTLVRINMTRIERNNNTYMICTII